MEFQPVEMGVEPESNGGLYLATKLVEPRLMHGDPSHDEGLDTVVVGSAFVDVEEMHKKKRPRPRRSGSRATKKVALSTVIKI